MWICFIFSLKLYQFLLHVFWKSPIRCTNIKDYYVLLLNWPLYHYEIRFFVCGNIPCSESCFVWHQYSHSSFLLMSIRCIFSQPFTLNSFSGFISIVCFCKHHVIESCFLIQSDNCCLLTGVFGPISFNVTIVTIRSETISCLSYLFCCCSPLPVLFWINTVFFMILFYFLCCLISWKSLLFCFSGCCTVYSIHLNQHSLPSSYMAVLHI